MKKTIEEVKDWLIENRLDEFGNIDLIGLDFSDFEGNINISRMKVKYNLYQSNQNVGGNLRQSYQKVCGDLYQRRQKVERDLYQSDHKVDGDSFQNNQLFGDYLYQDDEMLLNIYIKDVNNLYKKKYGTKKGEIKC